MMICAWRTSRRNASVTSMPSMSGRLMSIRTTSGWVSRANCSASSPVRAAPTTSMSDSNWSSLRRFSRVSAMSSTISSRMVPPDASAIPVLGYCPVAGGGGAVGGGGEHHPSLRVRRGGAGPLRRRNRRGGGQSLLLLEGEGAHVQDGGVIDQALAHQPRPLWFLGLGVERLRGDGFGHEPTERRGHRGDALR